MYIPEEQRKFLIAVLSTVILLVVDIFLILRPLINKTSDLRTQASALTKDIAILNQQISMMDARKKKLEELKTQYANYEKRFPKAEEEIPSLLESLSTIAVKSDIAIIGIRPVKPVQTEQVEKIAALFNEIPIEILAKGGYHQLGSFINRLEALDRFMEIKDMEINRDAATPRSHSLRLMVSTYILKTAPNVKTKPS